MLNWIDAEEGNDIGSMVYPVEMPWRNRTFLRNPIEDTVEVLLWHGLLIPKVLCVEKKLI